MQILIIDLGSQYTPLIGRRLRECGVRSLVLPPSRAEEWLKNNTPKGIILSGGYASIYEKDAPKPPSSLLSCGIPLLGICYGNHWVVYESGGEVVQNHSEIEYGEAFLKVNLCDPLFCGIKESIVWVSHGDSVTKLPEGFEPIGSTCVCFNSAIRSISRKIWGVQFHPEVAETECGKKIFENFLAVCGAEADWKPSDVAEEIRESVFRVIPDSEECVLAYSGGVDSSLLAKIVQPVLGDRLHCVTIDAGHLREGECGEIQKNARSIGVHLDVLDYQTVGASWFRGITDAETKRQSFQSGYFRALEEYARHIHACHLFQGTLYPDMIESSQEGMADLIKTHHNVGYTSRYFVQHHALGNLFKDEVRDLARALGLSPEICEREPFPGPGLFIRVVGTPVTEKNISIIRWADYEVRDIVRNIDCRKDISQLVVALIGVKTVGVKGDRGDYGYAICVRAVTTSDFMTCRGYQFEKETRRAIQTRLTTHPNITRVWFDENDKPPATVEFE